MLTNGLNRALKYSLPNPPSPDPAVQPALASPDQLVSQGCLGLRTCCVGSDSALDQVAMYLQLVVVQGGYYRENPVLACFVMG